MWLRCGASVFTKCARILSLTGANIFGKIVCMICVDVVVDVSCTANDHWAYYISLSVVGLLSLLKFSMSFFLFCLPHTLEFAMSSEHWSEMSEEMQLNSEHRPVGANMLDAADTNRESSEKKKTVGITKET